MSSNVYKLFNNAVKILDDLGGRPTGYNVATTATDLYIYRLCINSTLALLTYQIIKLCQTSFRARESMHISAHQCTAPEKYLCATKLGDVEAVSMTR